ncbi:FxsA family protein [Virgibacillus ndiopensis]|uniref:FxsA family protein n=1 Tax=Virgibacillus ndiopensis TaxID=2004408 RepID=UPI000C071CD7|nr:FxsA family protein [Virgibacillus ndiopensis]
MRWLLLALFIIPALEIGIFVWAGGIIGPWWVIALIILTGVVGITIAKRQGMETWNRARQSMSYGRVPASEMVDGICIFVGAVFLFTPGFVTDLVGFMLVLPVTRQPFKLLIQKFIKQLMDKGTFVYRKW